MVNNYEEADGIAKLVSPDENIFRLKKFQLKKVVGYAKNCMIKVFMDGSKALVNCNPEHHNEAYQKFIL